MGQRNGSARPTSRCRYELDKEVSGHTYVVARLDVRLPAELGLVNIEMPLLDVHLLVSGGLGASNIYSGAYQCMLRAGTKQVRTQRWPAHRCKLLLLVLWRKVLRCDQPRALRLHTSILRFASRNPRRLGYGPCNGWGERGGRQAWRARYEDVALDGGREDAEERVVNVLADEIDPARRAGDVGRWTPEARLELGGEVIPSLATSATVSDAEAEVAI
jgi:hypothetical protein